jgi:hypothetical protein
MMPRKTWITSKKSVHNMQKIQNSMRFENLPVKGCAAKMRFCEHLGPSLFVFWGVHCSLLKILNQNLDIHGEP